MHPTEAFLRQVDPTLEDEIRFEGATRDFLVVPMVPVRLRSTAGTSVKVWEPRRPWHIGKARRPAYWAVVRTAPGDDHTTGDWDKTRYRTRRAACTTAGQLATFDKARALIAPKE